MTSEGRVQFAMRSRTARTNSRDLERRESPPYNDKIIIERKLKPGDSLNKIAIQYSVTASELKRANNLVGDQEFAALTTVKIPVSKMRHALNIGLEGSASEGEDIHDCDDKTRLVRSHSRDPSVEEIFHKTDFAIAQVRDALPEEGSPGSFHFVDAKTPDSGCSVWLLLAAVVIIFMVVPLVLTFAEEEGEFE